MEDDFNEEGTYSINFDMIAESKEYSALVRLLAHNIKQNSYMSLGDFFKNIPDPDLEYMMDIIESVADEESEFDENDTALDELIIMTMMLNKAEGGEDMDMEETHKKINALSVLAVTTSLARRGLVDVYYENFSLQEDAENLMVAKRRDDIDYDSLLSDLDDDD
jgi:hypothetical protein